jgi:hypothetical protein
MIYLKVVGKRHALVTGVRIAHEQRIAILMPTDRGSYFRSTKQCFNDLWYSAPFASVSDYILFCAVRERDLELFCLCQSGRVLILDRNEWVRQQR